MLQYVVAGSRRAFRQRDWVQDHFVSHRQPSSDATPMLESVLRPMTITVKRSAICRSAWQLEMLETGQRQ